MDGADVRGEEGAEDAVRVGGGIGEGREVVVEADDAGEVGIEGFRLESGAEVLWVGARGRLLAMSFLEIATLHWLGGFFFSFSSFPSFFSSSFFFSFFSFFNSVGGGGEGSGGGFCEQTDFSRHTSSERASSSGNSVIKSTPVRPLSTHSPSHRRTSFSFRTVSTLSSPLGFAVLLSTPSHCICDE